MGSSDTFTPKVCTVVDAISHPTCSHDGSWSLSRLENGTKFVSHHIASNRHEYFKLLQVPCPEQMQHIRAIQELKETENSRRINKISFPDQQWLSSQNEFNKDSYPKSMINQMSLSPSDKLVEAAREVYYRKLTGPFARKDEEEGLREAFKKVDMENNEMSLNIKALMARQRWIKVGLILRRAGRDQDSNVEEVDRNLEIQSQKKQKRKQMTRRNINLEYRKKTKAMDVHYFLEMIDIKHRYGPNLRIYHEEWKKSRTLDNFFLWLDFGEGSIISCQACPRQRLERERVRYLSTEERRNYLVYIDRNGRLCWAKNGAHVDTSEKYCDSVNGIIPVTNQITKSPYSTTEFLQDNTVKEDYDAVPIFLTSLYSLNDGKSNEYDDQIHHFSTQKISRLHQVRDMKKVRHISAATIINRLLRESVKKNTWIFVADTSFRLYVGIKKSGVFQHSSFLRGGRISAAGSIRVEDGRLSRLSPLSGHYRPPSKDQIIY